MWCRAMIELEEKVCLYVWFRIGKKSKKRHCLGHESRNWIVTDIGKHVWPSKPSFPYLSCWRTSILSTAIRGTFSLNFNF